MFMKNWEEDDRKGHCAATEDLADSQAVCKKLGITLHTRNFSSEYWDNVFANFLAEYRAGRTPNPDVLCNREIKFKTFLEHALDLGAEKIATGHYARIRKSDDGYQMLRGADQNKDQSYFLYTLGQQQLARTLFPIGELPKSQVRHMAQEAGLVTHDKKDSTGICFIGERDFRSFLAEYLPAQAGDIVTSKGEIVGTHQGVAYYTLGQRQGLGIGGLRNAGGEPWFVIAKKMESNRLVVAQGKDHPALFSQSLAADQLTWIAGHPPSESFDCSAKTRYRQIDQPCHVEITAAGHCKVHFASPQRAVTPGQSVVFYAGEYCLGGGIIDHTW